MTTETPRACSSLRDKLIANGISSEAEIRAHCATALHLMRTVPELRLSRYNPVRPMEDIRCG